MCGAASGHVKAMFDTLQPRRKLEEAGPSMPVNVTGLDIAPGAGDKFYVVPDIAKAREIASQRHTQGRLATLGTGAPEHVTLENLFQRLVTQEVQTLNIILRADVRGSIEAMLKEFEKLEHPEVKIKVLQATVGGISEADVHLADASDAVIIGFNVVPDEKSLRAGRSTRRANSAVRDYLPSHGRFEKSIGRDAQTGETRSRFGSGPYSADICHQPAGNDCRLPRVVGNDSAERPDARDSRQPDCGGIRNGIAAAGEGRRARSSRRLGMRHQIGRIQRPQGG